MGLGWRTIPDDMRAFIEAQKLFFVATAPQDGRVNLSPKGLDTLRVLDERTVTYLDLTGSGNETAAHVTENGRMTMMFCAFSGKAMTLRLYGKADLIRPDHPEWATLRAPYPDLPVCASSSGSMSRAWRPPAAGASLSSATCRSATSW
ncbi:pyridoxamine 5'-phosphate oxidase family protein [Mesorhizobium amorphae]|uniref:pyridoxamine 5'-phosphate oxidase family protein n=1 Tax=Mesorhizobium amorphae TaxID=71433 RepID=UPI001C9081A4|nr:pyridoxamine 5'-phosphate oxidase family protein [Mesorhizobium amorphae]